MARVSFLRTSKECVLSRPSMPTPFYKKIRGFTPGPSSRSLASRFAGSLSAFAKRYGETSPEPLAETGVRVAHFAPLARVFFRGQKACEERAQIIGANWGCQTSAP
jgi:hypothetical protein